jgi:chitin disaccharide deacetylase
MADWIVGVCLAAAAAWVVVAQEPSRASDRTTQELLGHPPSARLLVLHADDLGMAHSVNRATFEALEQGWITSASILVPCPWFPEVARWARANPDADLGIHLALNSEWTGFRWGPVSSTSEVPSLVDADGYLPLIERPVVANARIPEVERELRAQIDRARAAGIQLTHLDSHMGTLFRSQELFDAYRRIGKDYGLPVLLERQGDRGGTGAQWQTAADPDAVIDRVLSIAPGVPTADWLSAYEKLLSPLPPGVYQLIVHLAHDDPEMRGATWDHPDWGAAWRQADLDLVRSPAFREFLQRQGFVLVTWKELGSASLRRSGEDRR